MDLSFTQQRWLFATIGTVNKSYLNPLTPNEDYSGRTAPLTSKVAFYIFIQHSI